MTAMEGPPNHPITFGEELRHLRESAGLSLDDVAAETKISKRILDALEEGEFRHLPERVFCRNFVVQYAQVVGADPNRVAASFEAAWDRFLLASGSHPKLLQVEAPPKRTIRWRFWAPIGFGITILWAAGVVILSDSRPESQLAPDPRRGVASRPIQVTSRLGRTAQFTPTRTVDGAQVVDENDLIGIVIRVRPDMECWIRYRDRNGMSGEKLLGGGDVIRYELAGPVKLTVGDASVVSIEVAGVEYDDLGRTGQVLHTEISSDGLTILGAGARDG
jgi:hypothetical protein